MAEFVWDTSTWDQTTVWITDLEIAGAAQSTAAASGNVAVAIDMSGTAGAVSETFGGSTRAAYVDADGSGIYVSTTTGRLYSRLPGCYRDADAAIGADPTDNYGSVASYGAGNYDQLIPSQDARPLLRWLASLVDEAGAIESVIDRCTPAMSSALTDPQLADVAWLPWLAQMVGLTLGPQVTPGAAQQAIALALTGPQTGTRPAIEAAVAPYLTGTQTVTVTDHYGGDAWTIQVGTLASETPASVAGQQGLVWGTSEWGVSAVWDEPDPVLWVLDHADLIPAGFTAVHTTS